MQEPELKPSSNHYTIKHGFTAQALVFVTTFTKSSESVTAGWAARQAKNCQIWVITEIRQIKIGKGTGKTNAVGKGKRQGKTTRNNLL